MLSLGNRSRPGDSIPTSSMADVAFLLLVFFLVTTVFPKDKGLPLVLPLADVETPVPPENVLHLFVRGGDRVEVMQGAAGTSYVVSVDRISTLWRERVQERPGLIAALKTSPEAPYGAMIDVLDALHSAGARRVSLQLDTR